MKRTSYESAGKGRVDRRRFLNTAVGACAAGSPLVFVSMQLAASMSES